MINLSSLLKNSAIFGLGVAISKAVGLLLLPLYTHYLSPADYGVLALLEFIAINFGIVVTGGLTNALMRFYHDRDDQTWRDVTFCSCLVVVGVIGAICVGIGMLAAPLISGLVLHSDSYALFVVLIMVTTAINVANDICYTLLRIQERAILYVGINMGMLALSVSLNVYFIAFLGLGIMGFVLSGVIAASVTLLVFVLPVILPHRARPDRNLIREMFRFSIPYVPNGFVSAFTHNLGVVCLSMTGDIVGAGLYAVGRKLGTAVSLLATPLGLVWTPFMYKVAKQSEAPRIYAVGTTYLVTFLFFVVLCLVTVIRDAIDIVADASFFDSYRAVLPAALGALAFTLGPTLRMGLAIAKKTGYIPLISAAATVVGFPLTYLLTVEFGMLGAAWGAASTWIIAGLLSAAVSRRFLEVPYEVTRLLKVGAAALVCVVFLLALADGPMWARLAVLACFPLLLIMLRVPTADERAVARRAVSRALAMVRGTKAPQS